jgi:hypothetical protein
VKYEISPKIKEMMQNVIDSAREYRLDTKRTINSIEDPVIRASTLKYFGWTEENLQEIK